MPGRLKKVDMGGENRYGYMFRFTAQAQESTESRQSFSFTSFKANS